MTDMFIQIWFTCGCADEQQKKLMDQILELREKVYMRACKLLTILSIMCMHGIINNP
jgi:hypothetical protein